MYGVEVIEGLRRLPDESVHCVVTSPPYFGLRDYKAEGQIGNEKTPEEFVEKIAAVFREVFRVLRKDGTAWVNIGDSYYNYRPGKNSGLARQSYKDTDQDLPKDCARRGTKLDNIQEKELIGIPWMVAFALRKDGWRIRSEIIWNKKNPMPSSVKDRPSPTHETIFLLTKSKHYFFDAFAIREKCSDEAEGGEPKEKIRPSKKRGDFNGKTEAVDGRNAFRAVVEYRNKRDVWTLSTEPYPLAHFACFPKKLVEPCILAGTSAEGVCEACGAPRRRITKQSGGSIGKAYHDHSDNEIRGNRMCKEAKGGYDYKVESVGFEPTCLCKGARMKPATVLDCFGGSGTTGEVATALGRDSILIDLQKDYEKLARLRNGIFIEVL